MAEDTQARSWSRVAILTAPAIVVAGSLSGWLSNSGYENGWFDELQKPVFRVQVFGDKPSIDDILGPDWDKGPVPHASLSHQEFLKMVTPEDVQGYAAFSSGEGATIAATSLLLQWTLQKALRKYRETTNEREREAARREVMEALDALEKARARAGKPPK